MSIQDRFFYYIKGSGKVGPCKVVELNSLYAMKKIDDKTQIFEVDAALIKAGATCIKHGYSGSLINFRKMQEYMKRRKSRFTEDTPSGERKEVDGVIKTLAVPFTSPAPTPLTINDLLEQLLQENTPIKKEEQAAQETSQPQEPTPQEVTAQDVFNGDLDGVCGMFCHLEVQLEAAIKSAYAAGENVKASTLAHILAQTQTGGLAAIAMRREQPPLSRLLRAAYDRGWNAETSAPNADNDFACWVETLGLDRPGASWEFGDDK